MTDLPLNNFPAVIERRQTLTEKQEHEWVSPAAVHKHCSIFRKPKHISGEGSLPKSPFRPRGLLSVAKKSFDLCGLARQMYYIANVSAAITARRIVASNRPQKILKFDDKESGTNPV
jgi:hypothetical protein